MSGEEIQQRIFTPKADLREGIDRIPLKTIHMNKCPIVAPAKVLRASDAVRLAIDIEQCQLHADLIRQSSDLMAKLTAVFSANKFANGADSDPDLMIYSGGFFPPADRKEMNEIRGLQPEALAEFDLQAKDSRLEQMLFSLLRFQL